LPLVEKAQVVSRRMEVGEIQKEDAEPEHRNGRQTAKQPQTRRPVQGARVRCIAFEKLPILRWHQL